LDDYVLVLYIYLVTGQIIGSDVASALVVKNGGRATTMFVRRRPSRPLMLAIFPKKPIPHSTYK
jgi:hypothetical protein